MNTFRPEPWQKIVLDATDPVLLLTGSAGGGKSRVALEKVHAFCDTFPNSTAVIARKTEDDTKASIIPNMHTNVIGLNNPRVKWRSSIGQFVYANGSRIFVIGMYTESQRTALRSIGTDGSVDIVFMEEAIEFAEEDYNEMLGRMRGRHGPFTQIILATNPGSPLHWIHTRLMIGGEARVIESSAQMNTHNPESYFDSLDKITGIEGARLRDGRWVHGEGLVIDRWLDDYDRSPVGISSGERPLVSYHEPKGNVTEAADFIQGGGPVVLAIDDGYAGEWDPVAKTFTARSHPRTFLAVQLRRDGRVAVFAENYAIKTLFANQWGVFRDEFERNNWTLPTGAVYDKAAAALEAELRQAGIGDLWRSPNDVSQSLILLNRHIGADENGVRDIIIHPRCRLLRLEMASYTFDPRGLPIKANDHGIDALRYLAFAYWILDMQPASVAVPEGIQDKWAAIARNIEEVYNKYMGSVGI